MEIATMRNVKTGLALTAVAAGLALAGAGTAAADSTAAGAATGSPGFLSGNVIQVPIHIPVNICGDTVSVIGALNPAFGNHCANNS
ncbi:chaplin [Streptacidiphilus albus]|uniref:chaplin n=1 Tax=Streptacidiphilus albus TaxID=105425 RepID=UPI003F710593